ncbi:MAG: hypothetical protein ABMB14_34925 [Myxococcota bacterium]
MTPLSFDTDAEIDLWFSIICNTTVHGVRTEGPDVLLTLEIGDEDYEDLITDRTADDVSILGWAVPAAPVDQLSPVLLHLRFSNASISVATEVDDSLDPFGPPEQLVDEASAWLDEGRLGVTIHMRMSRRPASTWTVMADSLAVSAERNHGDQDASDA